jgi:integrase
MATITQKLVENVKTGERELFIWDGQLDGFGVRVYPSGRRVYVAQWKAAGRTRRLVLGKYPLITAEAARRKAIEALAAVARGEDPAAERDEARASPTVAGLCRSWLNPGVGPTGKAKRRSTLEMDRSRIEAHIVPTIGDIQARNLTAAYIRVMVEKVITGATAVDEKVPGKPRARRIVKGGSGVAHRTLRMFRAILAHAVKMGLIAKNPAQHVQGGSEAERERFLSPAEMRRLGAALDAVGAIGASWQGIAAIRLILATGLRRNEALALRWQEVDLERRRLVLEQTKTGRSVRPLSRAAIAILSGIRERSCNGWVFPSTIGAGHIADLQGTWEKARTVAGLEDVHIHDLRHTFAASAAMSGASLLVVGRMLGHSTARSSERYSHLSDDFLSDAADLVADVIDLDSHRKTGSVA